MTETRPPGTPAGEAEKRKQRVIDYQVTFNAEAGRRVYADLRRFCKMDEPTFAGDPQLSAFNEGMRRVGLRIQAFLELNLDDAEPRPTEAITD